MPQPLGITPYAPTTLFLDAAGKTAFVHQGQYTTLDDLKADIARYL